LQKQPLFAGQHRYGDAAAASQSGSHLCAMQESRKVVVMTIKITISALFVEEMENSLPCRLLLLLLAAILGILMFPAHGMGCGSEALDNG